MVGTLPNIGTGHGMYGGNLAHKLSMYVMRFIGFTSAMRWNQREGPL